MGSINIVPNFGFARYFDVSNGFQDNHKKKSFEPWLASRAVFTKDKQNE